MNYTKDQTEYMIEKYKTDPSRDTVEELADEFSKSIKSSSANFHAKACIAVRSTRQNLAKTQLLNLRSLKTSLRLLESRVTIWWVSRKLQKRLLKLSREYYLSEEMVENLGEESRRESWYQRGSRLSRNTADFLVDLACRDVLFHHSPQRKKSRMVVRWRFM